MMLLEQSPMAVEELSARLAARGSETDPSAVPAAERRRIRTDLRHRCLPVLEATGWVERGPEGIVADEPESLETGKLSLPELRDPDRPVWEAVGVVLQRPCRQEVVSIAADRDPPITLEELVSELLERSPRATREVDERTLASELHHNDLPKLSGIGLIEYGTGERVIAPTSRLMRFVDQTGLDTEREGQR